jgi:membrane-bound serine protease (ClpP class)
MTDLILTIVAFAVGGLILLIAEICVPSFGLFAVGAMACLGGAIYYAYLIGPLWGTLGLILTLVGLPVYLYLFVKKLPSSFLGRMLTLKADTKPSGEGMPEAKGEASLLGRMAVADTNLRPSGAIRIDGKRLVATAEAGYIKRGAKVEIIKTGMNVVVRETEEQKQEKEFTAEGAENAKRGEEQTGN